MWCLLIDFLQVVDALQHTNAFALFRRAISRLCEYFLRQGLDVDPARIAHDLCGDWVA